MKSVSINFEYTEDEYLKGVKEYYEVSKTFGLFERWLITLCLAFSIILFMRKGLTLFTLGFTTFVLIIVLWALWLYGVKPQRDFEKTSKITNNFGFIFTKEKIAFKADKASCDFKWKIFKKLYETSDFFYLAQTKGSYTMIPKRAFASLEEIESFKKIVGEGNSSMEYIKK